MFGDVSERKVHQAEMVNRFEKFRYVKLATSRVDYRLSEP